ARDRAIALERRAERVHAGARQATDRRAPERCAVELDERAGRRRGDHDVALLSGGPAVPRGLERRARRGGDVARDDLRLTADRLAVLEPDERDVDHRDATADPRDLGE